jgi:Pectate lyase superfamily protein
MKQALLLFVGFLAAPLALADVSVRDHGAAGNGVADDTRAVQAASAAAVAANEALVFPPGTYQIATTTTVFAYARFAKGALVSPRSGVVFTLRSGLEAGPYQIFTTGAGTVRINSTEARVWLFLPQWFGATGDGTHDDTAALQATADLVASSAPDFGGVVGLTTGSYRITSTLRLSPPGASIGTGIVGTNSEAVRIQWYGGDAPAIALDGRTRGLRLQDFTLENVGRPGVGVGIRFGGDVIGTNHSRGTLERVRVRGFNEGIAIGDAARHAASEMTFRQLLVDHCGTGVVVRDNQSVNLEFSQLGLSYNTVGFLGIGGSGVHVIGGSVGHEPEDFAIRAELKRWTIEKVVSEGAGRFLTYGSEGGGDGNWRASATIRDNRVNNTAAADKRAIRIHAAGSFTIANNDLWEGHIALRTSSPANAGAYTNLLLTNNQVLGDVLLENLDDPSAVTRLTSIGNSGGANGVSRNWPDQFSVVLVPETGAR